MNEVLYTKNQKRLMKIGLLLLKITFDFMYQYIIKHTYTDIMLFSRGYNRNAFSFDFHLTKFILSYIITILFINWLISKIIEKDKPHEMIILALFCISFLPSMTLFAFSNLEWLYFIWNTVYWGWFLLLLTVSTKKWSWNCKNVTFGYGKKTLKKRDAESIFLVLIALFVLGSILISFYYYDGFVIKLSFSTEDVYSSRSLARGAFSTITNYFRNNAMYIAIPLLSILFLVKKRFLLFSSCMMVLLLLFSIDSQKAVLLLTAVSIGAVVIMKKKIAQLIIGGMLGVNVFAIFIYCMTGSTLIVDYLIKRIYFLPAIIGNCWYQYVNNHQNIVFMSSFFTRIGLIKNYAYKELGLPYQIGERYFGNSEISANTGAFAGAYAYGIWGILLIPLIYVVLFKLLDNVTSNLQPRYYMSVIIVMTFMIEGATLPSVLTVYGFFAAVILLYIMNCTGDFKIVRKGFSRFW